MMMGRIVWLLHLVPAVLISWISIVITGKSAKAGLNHEPGPCPKEDIMKWTVHGNSIYHGDCKIAQVIDESTPEVFRGITNEKWDDLLMDFGEAHKCAEMIADAPRLYEENERLRAVNAELVGACQKRIDEWHLNDQNFARKEPDSLTMMRKALSHAGGE